MRNESNQIIEHVIDGKCANLQIDVEDTTGENGASNTFTVRYPSGKFLANLTFQNGPIDSDGNGVNGLQHEVLIAIILDRLRSFNKTSMACRENEICIERLESCLHWMKKRTLARIARSVEGTHDE